MKKLIFALILISSAAYGQLTDAQLKTLVINKIKTQSSVTPARAGQVYDSIIDNKINKLDAIVPTWGSIIGTLSSQSDLQSALNAKQATLISGTNVKTINSNSIVGSGNVTLSSILNGSLTTNTAINGAFQLNIGTTTPLTGLNITAPQLHNIPINGIKYIVQSENFGSGSDYQYQMFFDQETGVYTSFDLSLLPNSSASTSTANFHMIASGSTPEADFYIKDASGNLSNLQIGPQSFNYYYNGAIKFGVDNANVWTINNAVGSLGQVPVSDGSGVVSWGAGGGLSTSLTAGHLYVGNVSNVATDIALSGDGTLSSAGALSVTKILGNTIPSNASGVLTNNGSGTLTWAAAGGTGTVTTASIVSANGFAGTVANPTTTPAITLTTSITGMLKGNGTAISAASNITDYVAPSPAESTTAFISSTGTNATGIIGRRDKPYRDLWYAINALPAGGGKVFMLDNGPFTMWDGTNWRDDRLGRCNGSGGANANTVMIDNLTIEGYKAPGTDAVFSQTGSFVYFQSAPTKLLGGSVIQGGLYAIQRANFRNFHYGVDQGSLYAATAPSGFKGDGLVLSANYGTSSCSGFPINAANGLNTLQTSNPPVPGFVADDITILGASASAGFHCLLLENTTAFRVNNIRTYFNLHGVVFKCQEGLATQLQCYGHGNDAMIIKSNDYANAKHITVDGFQFGSITNYDGGGIILDASETGSPGMLSVNVSNGVMSRCKFGIQYSTSSVGYIDETSFDNIELFDIQTYGVQTLANQYTARARLNNIRMRVIGGIGFDIRGGQIINISNSTVTSAGSDGFKLDSSPTNGEIYFDNIFADLNGGYGVRAIGSNVFGGIVTYRGNSTGTFTGTINSRIDAWAPGSGATLTAVNTITSNRLNGLIFTGTATATAFTDYMFRFGGAITSPSASGSQFLQIDPTLTGAGTGSQQIALLLKPTFSVGTTPTNIALDVNPNFATSSPNNIGIRVQDGWNIFGSNAVTPSNNELIYVARNQNAPTNMGVFNGTNGTAASASMLISTSSSALLKLSSYPSSYTPTLGYDQAGKSVMISSMANGLNLGTSVSSPIQFWTNSILRHEIQSTGSQVSTMSAQSSGTTPMIQITNAAHTGGAQTTLQINPGAYTGQTVGANVFDFYMSGARTVTWATGTVTQQISNYFVPPTLAAVASSTFTNAATMSILGPPIAGTNAIITNSHGLYIQSAAVGAATVTSSALTAVAPTGATTNWAGVFSGNVSLTGNLNLPVAGNGIAIKEGTNATMGRGTLVGGTLTINNTRVTANTEIFIGDAGGGVLANAGVLFEDRGSRSVGSSFTVKSVNVLDTSAFVWILFEPAP